MKVWPWIAAGVVAGVLVSCGGGSDGNGSGNGGGGGMPPTNAAGYTLRNLVSDAATSIYSTQHTDANLVNGWGIAFNPQGFVWVADNGSNKSTLYDGNGVPQSLVVSIPAGQNGVAHPTGIVFNGSNDFVVSQNATSGPSRFIFANQAGTIAAWSPGVDMTNAITVYDSAAEGKSYTGLALAQTAGGTRLYAADFLNRRIDVFDTNFKLVTTPGAFTDPNLPAGYSPFGIQAIGDRIYVAYAQANGADEQKGAGLGVLNVFDTSGKLIARLVSPGGPLNAPWGITMAPAGFGKFSQTLLVGDFGDGRIHGFDPNSGAYMGMLSAANGDPISIDGLWGIAFGNGLNNQPTNTLFFAAGPGDEAHGVYGRIDASQ